MESFEFELFPVILEYVYFSQWESQLQATVNYRPSDISIGIQKQELRRIR